MRTTWETMSTVHPIVRSPTLTTMVRVSLSAALGSSPKSLRRLMIGMIVPRRLLTPSQYAGTWGVRVTWSRITISWICSIRKAYSWSAIWKPTNCDEFFASVIDPDGDEAVGCAAMTVPPWPPCWVRNRLYRGAAITQSPKLRPGQNLRFGCRQPPRGR